MHNYPYPKIDLHLHLDGSFRLETMWNLAQKQNVKMPADSLEGYRDFMIRCSDAQDVNDYLKMFDAPVAVMQNSEAITVITKELIEDLAKQGLAYAEIRFAPQLHTKEGLSMDDAVEAVLEGRKQALAMYPDIEIGIITCMMCIGTEKVNWDANMETVEVCKRYLGKGVVALDLAGAEGIVPLSNFGPLFEKAREYNLPIICHAGDSQDYDTVRDAIDFKVSRIGHGHHIYNSKELCKEAANKHIALEICPTSNIQCKTQPSFKLHPAKQLLDMGIPVTINTDNMVMARTTLDKEYDHCINEMGFSENDIVKCLINSANSSFMNPDLKKEIIAKLITYVK